MRNRDPHQKKARDLRRIARSGGYSPSIFDLFRRYHPEVEEREEQIRQECRWYFEGSEYTILRNMEYDWATKIAGYWNAIGGSSSYYRQGRRAREKQALRRAVRDDAWDDFFIPRERRDWD